MIWMVSPTCKLRHLMAVVSILSEYELALHVSGLKTMPVKQEGGGKRICHDGNTIYTSNGTILMGHYDDWAKMDPDGITKVIAECKCKKKQHGLGMGKFRGKGADGRGKCNISDL